MQVRRALLCLYLLCCAFLNRTASATIYTWTNNADGTWSVAANWQGGTPATTGDAVFTSTLVTADRIITLGANTTINSLTYGSTNAYTITGARTFTLTSGLTNNGSGAAIFDATTALKLGANQAWTGNGSGLVDVRSILSGNAIALTKNGTFTLQLSNANTFTGGLTVNAGTVQFGNNAGAGTGTLILNGGTILAVGAGRNLANAITVGGDFTIGGTTNLMLSGAISLGGTNRTITVTSTASATNSGIISGTAGFSKAGSGTLVMAGASANTFTGGLTISNGTIQLGSANRIVDLNSVTNYGGTLDLNNFNESISNLTMTAGTVMTGTGTLTNGGTITTVASASVATISGKLNLNGANTSFNIADGGAGSDLTISAVITNGTITKIGAGLLTLSGANTWTGNLTNTAGTVSISADSNLGNTNNDVVFNGGTLNLSGTFTNAASRVYILNSGGGVLDVNSGVTNTLAATNQISGSGLLTKTGSGMLSLTASNVTFSGNTLLSGGTISLGHLQALGSGNLTVSNSAELQLAVGSSANNVTLGNITMYDGTIRRTTGSGTRTGLLATNSGTLTINGNAQLIDQGTNGYLSVEGAVQINNGGTLTLNSVNRTNAIRLDPTNSITIGAGGTLATTGSGTNSIGSLNAPILIGTGTNGSEATFSIGSNTTYNVNTALKVNGATNININGLRVAGSSASVNNFLTKTRVQGLTGSGGTLTIAFSDNASSTFTNGPTAPSLVLLGFDSQGGSTPTYTIGNLTNDLQNFRGLVIKGGTVIAGADETFSAGDSSLNMMGGTFQLSNIANGGQNVTFKGDAYLTNGIIDGGVGGGSHGTLIIGGNIVASTNITLNNTPNLTMNPVSKTNTISGTGLDGIGNFTKDGTSDSEVILNGPITASGIYINQGTLLLGGNNYIRGSPSLNLAGGTFHSGGYSNTFGVLTLTANSIINFGTGTNSFLTFANSASLTNWTAGVTLTLIGWSGSTNGGGTEGIRFGTDSTGLTSNQIAQIRFTDPAGFASGSYAGSMLVDGEVVPVPIPEVNTVVAVLLLAFLIIYRERKTAAKLFRPALARVRAVRNRFKS